MAADEVLQISLRDCVRHLYYSTGLFLDFERYEEPFKIRGNFVLWCRICGDSMLVIIEKYSGIEELPEGDQ
jgi:hypothetical protein